ncbi:MAG: hypothetical protein QNJ51_10805 [Calothrix sp. MO_167.B12]|nr:hypothetical protein [Calothrix sp. MO_167.B12]
MSKLFDILEKIRVRPAMYIGRASVSDLFHFLVGFKTALRELKVKATEEEMDFYREFQPWVQEKYHVSTSNSWAKIIMLHCGSEKEGLDAFYKLLYEFQNRETSFHKKEQVANISENITEAKEEKLNT